MRGVLGDLDGYLKPCTKDFHSHVPGRGAIAGIYRGKQGLYDLAGKAMTVTAGSFLEEVEDVLANDRHTLALARHEFQRDGKQRQYRTVHVCGVRDGKLAAGWEQPRDLVAFDEAWGLRSGM